MYKITAAVSRNDRRGETDARPASRGAVSEACDKLVGDVHIGVYVLHVVEILKGIDQPHEFLCAVTVNGYRGRGDHGDFAALRHQPGFLEGRLDGSEVFPGGGDIHGAVVIGLDVLGTRLEGGVHQLVLINTCRKVQLALAGKEVGH